MPETRTCPNCGASLSAGSLREMCPRCVLRRAIDAPLTELTDVGPPLESIRCFGDYELLEEIARGGMGVVYRARQVSLNRTVAVKMILAGHFAGREAVQRFHAEAEAAARLQHPNIVAIYEVGEHDGQQYFSMEYIAGQSLAELVRDQPMSPARTTRYVQAIADTVHYAHERGTLHRDLKPSNVLIDAFDQPRITDFGLAKQVGAHALACPASPSDVQDSVKAGPQPVALQSDLTLTGEAIGSPQYMPPEQATGRRGAIGPRSDLYSIGAILYHLLTGRPPFVGETVAATLAQVESREPMAPRELNPGVPRDLETICLKCLEKAPERRFGSARELAEELGRFNRGEPILARPVTAPEKLWRWARRNPKVAALAMSLLAVIGTGLAGVSWQWRRAERHAQIETQQRLRVEQLLAHREIERAEDLFTAGDVSAALTRLARVVRQDLTNEVAATRLLSALTSRNFALPVAAPMTHEAAVLSAQFSPDGQRVVTAAEDGVVRVWDARLGRRLIEVRHPAAARSAEFSSDGRRIVTASEDSTARVWDAQTGQPVTPPLQHGLKVRRAHFSADGGWVVTASGDATARVWDSQTGQPVASPLQHAKYVNDAAFSPDSQWIVTASDDDTACVWDARTGRRLAGPLQHRDDVWSARFSPDGRRLVTASSDRTARIWDAVTGQPLTAALPHQALVMVASFNPNGTRVVTASWDDTARVWDATTGEPVTPPLSFDSDVLYAEFSPDGRKVFTIADAAARVWDAETGAPLTEPIVHEAPLRHLGGFSPDGGRVVTASFDKSAIVWDVRSGAALPEVLAGFQASRAVACSPDGRWLAAARGREFTAHVWDAATGEIVTGPLPHEGLIMTTQFSPDGRRLLTACRDGNARLWDARSGELTVPLLRHQGPVNSAQFSRDGRRIVSASDDETARIWDAATGREMIGPLRHGAYVHWAEFSPDVRTIVTASGESGDRSAQVWDATTGQPLGLRLRHELGLQYARFSPNGRLILTASEDGTARLWDAGTGQPVGRPLTHRGHVRWAEFSRDGRWVVTASQDKTARVWDAVTGEPVTEPLKHVVSVHAAHFSPNGRRVVTVDLEPAIRIRDAAMGHLLFEPFQHEAKVEAVLFLPDGERLATVGGERRLRLWETPILPMPVPDWVPELAETIAAKRVDAQGRSVPVSASRLVQFRQRFSADSSTNFYARWARWFFSDRDKRAVSPFASIGAKE